MCLSLYKTIATFPNLEVHILQIDCLFLFLFSFLISIVPGLLLHPKYPCYLPEPLSTALPILNGLSCEKKIILCGIACFAVGLLLPSLLFYQLLKGTFQAEASAVLPYLYNLEHLFFFCCTIVRQN